MSNLQLLLLPLLARWNLGCWLENCAWCPTSSYSVVSRALVDYSVTSLCFSPWLDQTAWSSFVFGRCHSFLLLFVMIQASCLTLKWSPLVAHPRSSKEWDQTTYHWCCPVSSEHSSSYYRYSIHSPSQVWTEASACFLSCRSSVFPAATSQYSMRGLSDCHRNHWLLLDASYYYSMNLFVGARSGRMRRSMSTCGGLGSAADCPLGWQGVRHSMCQMVWWTRSSCYHRRLGHYRPWGSSSSRSSHS